MAERAYIRDGAEIYRRSFAIIRAEAELGRFDALEERVAVRIIHACGMTEIARDIVMSPGFADNARWSLVAGAPVLCDSKMVANGITRARLPRATRSSAPSTIPRWRRSPSASATPVAPPRWICGANGWRAPWWRSATHRPLCSA